MTTLQSVALDLAKSGEAVKSGPIGFAVILVLCVACYFLFKSMANHLRKVREDFPSDGSAAPPAAGVEPTPPAAGSEHPAPGGAVSDGSGELGVEPRERT